MMRRREEGIHGLLPTLFGLEAAGLGMIADSHWTGTWLWERKD